VSFLSIGTWIAMSEEVDPIAILVAILTECKDVRWCEYYPPRVVVIKRLAKR